MPDVCLSICIPTYNFAPFLAETLESIVCQAGDYVEIIVGDGGSTDNTAEIVTEYQSRFPRLTYRNFEKKGGFDLDLAKTVELARGDYCWLMSGDDALKPGAMKRVLGEIQIGHDVYLFNRTICDRNLKPLRRQESWLSKKATDSIYHIFDKSDLFNYLNASQSIGALFSYISSIVVRRSAWNEVGFDKRFDGSNYAHVFRLFSKLTECGSSLKYVEDPLILCRGYNDSFLNKGLVHRFLIDFDGYRTLEEILFFDDDKIRNAFRAVMRREHPWYSLSRLKSEVGDDCKWKELEQVFIQYGYSSGELFLIKLLGSSKLLVALLRSTRRFLETQL